MTTSDRASAITGGLWFFVLTAVSFTVLTADRMRGDLWFDELITLFDFAAQPHPSDPFLRYPVANNHILFSFLLWIWLRVCEFSVREEILRLPCLLLAFGTLAACFYHSRRLYNTRLAILVTVLLAASPVYQNAYYQLRGYGLSLFLAALATFGALYLARGEIKIGLWNYLPATLLLPGVIPTNGMLNLALLAFIYWEWLGRGEWPQRRRLGVILAAGSIGGAAIYLPILPQFIDVSKTTYGWHSAGAIYGNLLAASLVHCGAFVMVGVVGSWVESRHRVSSMPSTVLIGSSWWKLAVCCVIPVIVFAFAARPFPRVFLVFFIPLTLIAAGMLAAAVMFSRVLLPILILAVVGNSAVASRLIAERTRGQLVAGESPQDLLCHYYAGNRDMSTVAGTLAHVMPAQDATRIFVDFHFYPTLRYYWSILGRDGKQVECLRGGSRFPLQLAPEQYWGRPGIMVAYHTEAGAEAYHESVGRYPVLEPIAAGKLDILYRIVGDAQ